MGYSQQKKGDSVGHSPTGRECLFPTIELLLSLESASVSLRSLSMDICKAGHRILYVYQPSKQPQV